jgi:hypothetical protein
MIIEFLHRRPHEQPTGTGATGERVGEVVPLPRRGELDVDTPFRPFRHAGLINARFAIDGQQPFWGYHDPRRRWNGWATPGFLRPVADLIVAWLDQAEPGMSWWDREVLHVLGGDGDYVEKITVDELGLYRFEGWIWLEVDDH